MDFFYSENIEDIGLPELRNCCFHLLCTEGEGSLVYYDRCFHFRSSDLLVLPRPEAVSNLALTSGTVGEFFAADYKFLQNQLPANNYSIGGSISLYGNPVISLTSVQADVFLADIHRLRDRMEEKGHRFYRELMGSLCLTMMYDIFSFHSQRDGGNASTERAGFFVNELMRLLAEGNCRTERSVGWYAAQLSVSEKYLSSTVKRLTGHSVMSFIDRHTIPILKEYLNNPRYSLTQIADRMNFASLSYFSRYCKKHLGRSPSEYRSSLQPQG
ncbi:MAG: AraC family transcriptional regulator [Bacteroidales bacterium]|nr:AraC family transcriptional regulator [Bacteroidales bacterium]